MKRKAAIIFIICILLMELASCKSTNDIENGFNIFLFDIETNRTTQLGDQKYIMQNVDWSEDDNYFMFVNENIVDEIKVYKSSDIKQIEIPKSDKDKNEYKYVDAEWVNNDEILITNKNVDSVFKSEIFSVETGKITNMTTIPEKVSNIDPANVGVNDSASTYIIEKIEAETGLKLYESNITKNGEQIIFRADDFQVYLMDLTTGKSNRIFKGFNIQWSPSRTKVSYNIHKTKELDVLDDNDGYNSDSLVTYIYDFNTGKSTKVADFGTRVFFSYYDKYMVFFECAYGGLRGEI